MQNWNGESQMYAVLIHGFVCIQAQVLVAWKQIEAMSWRESVLIRSFLCVFSHPRTSSPSPIITQMGDRIQHIARLFVLIKTGMHDSSKRKDLRTA